MRYLDFEDIVAQHTIHYLFSFGFSRNPVILLAFSKVGSLLTTTSKFGNLTNIPCKANCKVWSCLIFGLPFQPTDFLFSCPVDLSPSRFKAERCRIDVWTSARVEYQPRIVCANGVASGILARTRSIVAQRCVLISTQTSMYIHVLQQVDADLFNDSLS